MFSLTFKIYSIYKSRWIKPMGSHVIDYGLDLSFSRARLDGLLFNLKLSSVRNF